MPESIVRNRQTVQENGCFLRCFVQTKFVGTKVYLPLRARMHSHVRDHRNTRELHRFSSSEKHSKSYPVYTRHSDGLFGAHHEFLESIKKGKNTGTIRPVFGHLAQFRDHYARVREKLSFKVGNSPILSRLNTEGLTNSYTLIASYSCYGGRN